MSKSRSQSKKPVPVVAKTPRQSSRKKNNPSMGSTLSLSKVQKRALVDEVMARFKLQNPQPKTELYSTSPFQLLVSVVLSAQTTDKMVNRTMRPLYDAPQGFTPQLVVTWGESKLLNHIKSIGLAPTKAKNVVRLSQLLIERHQSAVPLQRAALEDLPGVGRKTANVVLAELAGAPTLAVDTHVFRVTRRLGLHNEATPLAAESVLLAVVDAAYLPQAHHWFILHGRYVCKAQNPACRDCLLNDLCPSLREGQRRYRKTSQLA